jgi:hypothetical protein
MKVRELALGRRAGVMLVPADLISWPPRIYRGSGHRFFNVWRLSFWIRWAY